MRNRKWAEEPDMNHPGLFVLLIEIIHRFLYSTSAGSHNNDDAVWQRMPIIFKEFISSAGEFPEFFHLAFNYCGHLVIVRIGCFAVLEENVRILSGPPNKRIV